MNNDIVSSDNNSKSENIDLAYDYTKDTLKNLSSQIENLRSRSATFLGFAGILLRFNIDLSDSSNIYLFTKIVALLTSFGSIALLGCALSSEAKVEGSFRESVECFLQNPLVEVKKAATDENINSCEYLISLVFKIKKLLNLAISCLVVSALFFAINVILVSFSGKQLPYLS